MTGFGLMTLNVDEEQPFLGYEISQGRGYSETSAAGIDEEVQRLLKERYDSTRKCLMERKAALDLLICALMEFLFVSLFQWAKVHGYFSFNLGLSALSGVGEQASDPTIERVMHFIYEHVNQFYNFKGLHTFKEKFHPEWSPRYLIYRGSASLAQAWLAVVEANSGSNNFLSGYFKRATYTVVSSPKYKR